MPVASCAQLLASSRSIRGAPRAGTIGPAPAGQRLGQGSVRLGRAGAARGGKESVTQGPNPTVQRRRLRVELRRARAAAGLTQREVADDLGWSLSKLLRIENGQVGVSRTDLKALLDRYSVTSEDQINSFVRLAREGRRQAWGAYRDVLNPDYMIYLGYEGSASMIRQFEYLVIPGLLQTEAYARTVIRGLAPPGTAQTTMDRQVKARMARQDLLNRDDAPEMFFIMDEAVIRRWVGPSPGDPSIMREQLERLKELGSRPSISIQILPFKYGIHYGLRGPFVLLEFPDPEDDDLLFIENPSKSLATRDNPEVTALYKTVFWELESVATDPKELTGLVDRVLADMSK
jgi:transcriptional regulator with XRE-family HTH domain